VRRWTLITSRRRHAAALFPIVDGVLMAGSTVPKVKTAGDQSEYMDVKDEDVSWLLHALAWPW